VQRNKITHAPKCKKKTNLATTNITLTLTMPESDKTVGSIQHSNYKYSITAVKLIAINELNYDRSHITIKQNK